MDIVLRVSSPTLDLDACLAWIPASMLQRSWRLGESRAVGKPSSSNGFNLLLADADTAKGALAQAQAALERLAVYLRPLVEAATSVEVDIALFVEELPRSLRLPKEFLASVVHAGIELVVTVYPCSDEEKDDLAEVARH